MFYNNYCLLSADFYMQILTADYTCKSHRQNAPAEPKGRTQRQNSKADFVSSGLFCIIELLIRSAYILFDRFCGIEKSTPEAHRAP